MSIDDLLRDATDRLSSGGYVHAGQEAEIFLKNILNQDSGWLLAHSDQLVDEATVSKLDQLVEDRLKGRPLGYILGLTKFFGWEFQTDERALIPRTETEQLLELIVKDFRRRQIDGGKFLEIGTGSGVVAVSLKKFFPETEIMATDVSDQAIELAEDNAVRLKVAVDFLTSDLLAEVPRKKFDLVVANLPYVPSQKLSFAAEQILDWEPLLAIDGGEDGLKYIRPLLASIQPYLKDQARIFLEVWHTHGTALKKLIKQYLPEYELEIHKDLAGFDRFAVIRPKN